MKLMNELKVMITLTCYCFHFTTIPCIGAQCTGSPTRMMKQTKKILVKHLKRLKEKDLETFKMMFCKMKPPRGKMKIQNRHLKNKSAAEIAEKIVESYTVRNGPSHVRKVLKKMGLNEIRSEFQKDMSQARKKYKEKRSNAKVQVAEGDRTHLNNHTTQKKRLNVEAQDGVPTSPQTQREVNSRVLKPEDNQEEPNNVPRKVGPQITKPDTSQDTFGIPISLTDQNEGKHYMTKLEEGQEGTDYKVLKSNIKQEKQESFLEYREIEEFGNTKAIPQFRNSDMQEQSQNQGDPKDDVRIDGGLDEQPKIEATKVKLRKRPEQNTSMGKKQEQVQLKSPTGKLKQPQQAKKDQIDEQPTQSIKVAKHEGLSRNDLSKYIKDLKDESFKDFKTCLNDGDFLKPYLAIPKASLEKADRLDVAELLINFYTKEEAPSVTIKILKEIGEANLAKQMEKILY